MIARLDHLRKHPAVFRHLTGLTVPTFEALAADVVPAVQATHRAALDRPGRRRAIGAGGAFGLGTEDQVLMSVIWLRQYPTQEVLGFLFGVSDSTALRAVRRCLPVLEQAGRDTMRMPDPGPGRRKKLPALLSDTPGLAVVIDTFEQRVQRPRGHTPEGKRMADAFYSGKKKQHTGKTHGAVDEETGAFVDVPDSVPGPTADLTLLKDSGLLRRLPPGVGGRGDLAYVGGDKLVPGVPVATPRRKPRGRPRPPADAAHNTAFARRRIVVEHSIGRLRRYQALTQTDRHRRRHGGRARAAAGLVNRQLARRCPF